MKTRPSAGYSVASAARSESWTKVLLSKSVYICSKVQYIFKKYPGVLGYVQDDDVLYDVQIDVESRKLAPYTDPLKRPKNRKCIHKTVNAFTVP